MIPKTQASSSTYAANLTWVAAQDSHTELAAQLNLAMAHDLAAQAAYLATWGVEWMPLPLNGAAPKSFAITTTLATCL